MRNGCKCLVLIYKKFSKVPNYMMFEVKKFAEQDV
jgi:hypothetical protein